MFGLTKYYSLLMLSLLIFFQPANAQVSIADVKLVQQPENVKIEFSLTNSTRFRYFYLKNPDRLVLDVRDAKGAFVHKKLSYVGTPVKKIRYAAKVDGRYRIVVDLFKPIQAKIHSKKVAQKYPYHIIIDFPKNSKVLNTNSVKLTSNASFTKINQHKATLKTNTIKLKNSENEVLNLFDKEKIKQENLPLPKRIVAIDAGHGGEDPGAIGKNGTKEKAITLKIAKQLEKIINNSNTMSAVLTRQADYFIPLRKRIALARAHGADLFVSIHADGFHDSSVKGSSVYVLSEAGASSEAARWLAAKENSADLIGGVSLDDKSNMLASVLLDLSQNASKQASFEFGEKILAELKEVTSLHKKHVEKAAFAVLKSPDIPSILIETDFVSNPEGESNLQAAKFQKKIAHAIFKGIKKFFAKHPIVAEDQHCKISKLVYYKVEKGDTLSAIAKQFNVTISELKQLNTMHKNILRAGAILNIPKRDPS